MRMPSILSLPAPSLVLALLVSLMGEAPQCSGSSKVTGKPVSGPVIPKIS